jgi:hypothetical protein
MTILGAVSLQEGDRQGQGPAPDGHADFWFDAFVKGGGAA